MNIIETVKKKLSDFPRMEEFSSGIHIDFTENTPGNFGLYSTGDALIKKDILGNQKRKHNFVLYANNQPFNDYERLANSTFLLELNYWLETIKSIPITALVGDAERNGYITKMYGANGMLFAVPTGDINNGVTYQLQIYAEYTVESEEN